MASERSTARFSEIRASAMGSEGASRNGWSDRSGGGSAAELDRAAIVRARLRKKLILSQANIDTEKSLDKRLVFVICVILIDSLFWGFVAKICTGVGWPLLFFSLFLRECKREFFFVSGCC
jgi:hypothetical protein